MSLHLRFRFGACRQRRHRQKFAGAPVHVVAGEDVAEEMGFQIFVELRMEIEKTALDRSTAELCLIGGPEINGFPRGKRGRLFPLGNRTIRGDTFVHHVLQRGRGVQSAGKTAVGIKLSDILLRLGERKSSIESAVQRGSQCFLFAAGDGGSDVDDDLFFDGQNVHGFLLFGFGFGGRQHGCRGKHDAKDQRFHFTAPVCFSHLSTACSVAVASFWAVVPRRLRPFSIIGQSPHQLG